MRPRRSKTQGFTLIEMMVVVAIIGIVTATVGPGLGAIMADGRQGSAATELLRQARSARSESQRMGVAYLMRFDSTASNDLGAVSTFAGATSSCLHTPWAQVFDANAVTNNRSALAFFDMDAFNGVSGGAASDTNRHVITLRAQQPYGTAAAMFDICFQPNGETFTRTLSTAPLLLQRVPAVWIVRRTLGVTAVEQGVAREILLPPGGAARFR